MPRYVAVNVKLTSLKEFLCVFQVQAKELLEQTANSIATDVVDFCTAFTQKTAVDKAVPEIDKRLSGVGLAIRCKWGWSGHTLYVGLV